MPERIQTEGFELPDLAAAPGAPPANRQMLYFRGGTLYKKGNDGVETAVGTGGPGGGGLYSTRTVTKLVTDYSAADLFPTPILTGSFVATRTDPVIEFEVCATIAGQASVPWWFFYGTAATLYDSSGLPINGAQVEVVGKHWYDTSDSRGRTVQLSGLTIGQTYNWAVIPGVIGVTARIPTGDGPNRIAVTPDSTKGVVCLFNGSGVQVLYLEQPWAPYFEQDSFDEAGPFIATGTFPYGVACTNTKACVVNFFGDSMSVIDLATETIDRTVTGLTGGVANPRDVVISPDGTTAWVTTSNGLVKKITISTGAVTSITVLAGKDLRGIAISKDGTKVWVGNYTDSTVYRITAATNAVSAAISLTADHKPEQIRVSTNAVWVLSNNAAVSAAYLQEINPTTEVLANTYATVYPNAKDFVIGADEKTAYAVFTNGLWGEMFLTGPDKGATHVNHRGQGTTDEFGATYTGAIGGVATDGRSQIWVTQFDVDQIFKWPGARITCTAATGGLFLSEYAALAVLQ